MSLSTDDGLLVSPPARRAGDTRWRDPRLLVGLALVAGSAVLGATVLGGADERVGVWALRSALAAGQPVEEADLVRREVAFTEQVVADVYLSADVPLPDDAVLVRDVGAGELLPRDAWVTGAAPVLAEVPVGVPAEAVPATVRPGSVVDVWVTPDPELASAGAEPAAAEVVLEAVRVVDVVRGGGSLGPSPTVQVLVGVPAERRAELGEALAALARGSAVLVRTQ